MFKWLKDLCGLFKRRDFLVEIPQGLTLDPEGLRAVPSLKAHPGFLYLLTALQLKKAVLEARLRATLELKPHELAYLQAGIYWLGYIESVVSAQTQAQIRESRPAQPSEQAIFDDIKRSIQVFQ
jgi:hypothetical protein